MRPAFPPSGFSLLEAVASPLLRPSVAAVPAAAVAAAPELCVENTVTGVGAEMVLTLRESAVDLARQASFRRQQRRGQQQQHTTSTTTTVAAHETVPAMAAGRTTSSSAGVIIWRHSGAASTRGGLPPATSRLRRVGYVKICFVEEGGGSGGAGGGEADASSNS